MNFFSFKEMAGFGHREAEVETVEKPRTSQFMDDLLTTVAADIGGKVDLDQSIVTTECGHMRLAQEGIDVVIVSGLFVDSEKQQQGCGTRFIESLRRAVAKLSSRTVEIRLWPLRSAVGFYLRNGFGLVVDTSEESDYSTIRAKLFGSPAESYLAKTRLKVMELAGDGPWTHDILWPLFEKSSFPLDRPLFYSLWVSDLARGEYIYAAVDVQPNRGKSLAANV